MPIGKRSFIEADKSMPGTNIRLRFIATGEFYF
jgi:hypothetical protein